MNYIKLLISWLDLLCIFVLFMVLKLFSVDKESIKKHCGIERNIYEGHYKESLKILKITILFTVFIIIFNVSYFFL